MLLNKIIKDRDGVEYKFMHNDKIPAKLKKALPEVEDATGIRTCVGWTSYKDKKLFRNIAFLDSSFFNIFSFDLLVGHFNAANWTNNDVLITKEYADKIIRAQTVGEYSELIGQTIEFADLDNKSLTIRGIFKPIPKNSSIDFDLAVNFKHAEHYGYNGSSFHNTNVYVKLKSKEDKEIVEKKSSLLNKSVFSVLYNAYVKKGTIKADEKNLSISLVNIRNIYFSDKIAWKSYAKKGDKTRSDILICISILVLLIACINYIMLSIGLSMKRFKEIAIKKVFGSKRRRLIFQLITETGITVLFSLILGIVIAELILPLFKEFTGNDIDYVLYSNFNAYIFLICIAFVIIAVVSIPSIYISKLNPIRIFRNESKLGSKLALAKSFMIIQFTLSLILIISSVFIIKHIHFMKNHEVGFDTKNLIGINLPSTCTNDKAIIIEDRYQKLNGVINTGRSDRDFSWGTADFTIRYNSENINIRAIGIDTSYIKTLRIKLISGRNLRETDNMKPPYSMVVNEAFVRRLRLDNPIGTQIKAWNSYIEIVGLVKDFNYSSMRNDISPFCFMNRVLGKTNVIYARLKPESGKKTIEEMSSLWSEFDSEREFDYFYVGDSLKKLYRSEEKTSKIIISVTVIALFISLLGLLGLTMLLLMQKIKEIGIRKINGATTKDILIMINKEFAKYLLIAALVAIPVSYYGLTVWLENFAYKTPLSLWVFVVCFFFLGIIVIATISYKSIRASLNNPVDSIKYE
jgi:putative ABC transport system permease protein